jgi:hypothetical protein
MMPPVTLVIEGLSAKHAPHPYSLSKVATDNLGHTGRIDGHGDRTTRSQAREQVQFKALATGQ